jgi:hypothetical protein
MDETTNTNNQESTEPDKQELTPEELERMSGGAINAHEPPDPC